jgi:hypothetical protein
MEERPDGTLLVYGAVTAEKPDLIRKKCDFDKTESYYPAKVETMFKLPSGIDGVTPSIYSMAGVTK